MSNTKKNSNENNTEATPAEYLAEPISRVIERFMNSGEINLKAQHSGTIYSMCKEIAETILEEQSTRLSSIAKNDIGAEASSLIDNADPNCWINKIYSEVFPSKQEAVAWVLENVARPAAAQLSNLQQENERLKELKESAMKNTPDYQMLGNLLGIKPGTDVEGQLVLKIGELLKDIEHYAKVARHWKEQADKWFVEQSAGDGWISVETPPKEEGYCLICRTYGQGRKEVWISFFRKDHQCFDDFLQNIITDWKPLPAPPKM